MLREELVRLHNLLCHTFYINVEIIQSTYAKIIIINYKIISGKVDSNVLVVHLK